MNQILPFLLGSELYALQLDDIQEIVEQRPVHPLPGVVEGIAGAIDFHGRVVVVVDLPLLLGFDPGSRNERMIVLTNEHGPVALLIDQMRRIISLDLLHSTLSQSHSEADCIRGVINLNGEMISLLDLEQLRQRFEQICGDSGEQQ